MKIRLIAVGKVREPYVAAAVADFVARLRHYDEVAVHEVAAAHGADPQRAMREEGARILRAIAPDDTLWLLERTGTQLGSVELVERLAALALEGRTRLTIALAGTYGADAALLARADFQWSLSRLTFLHEWARAIVLEQLYRAAKIARNEPYHH
ncbi:MAG: 23S rRNA (pseudouridine(1915)-N(3))-methyltransferase RlmH [Candidatus Eremiobacteraeota bacterium]|nr:23S rRNA (pseudouridine(1915)-N(3))-methyltransferase RlmH [Candidatus Eremiobacteraeota bacterium]